MIKVFLFIVVFLSVAGGSLRLCAQSGMEFGEFSRKLEYFYDKEFIEDIKQQLPQGIDYRVWGWDVGDFSGDGYNDVAFTVRLQNDKRKNVSVYLFVDVDGYLNNIGTYPYQFVETPLEVGVAIKNDACYVTKKRKQFDWSIRGYTYSNGSVLLLDEFNTNRIDKYTRETYDNFQTLRSFDRFLLTSNNAVTFSSDFLTIPMYPRGTQVYKGFTSTVTVSSIDFVNRGAFYWTGEDDCSFTARSAYDDKYLYVNLSIRDSDVVIARCDTCPADKIELWFDTTPRDSNAERVMLRKGKKVSFRTAADSNIYKITLNLGDFAEKRPWITVQSTEADDADVQMKIALQQVTKKVALRPHGYAAKLRIPWTLLGFDKPPIEDNSITRLGMTVAILDVDNEYRLEEATLIATSQFREMNPASFGEAVVIPADRFYGESLNIYTDSLLKYLNELGF
ncbi:MAG: hypothetical protein JNL32_03235 [Candidatus Kapabacteria bacterium]|nr:hypothetical protein [Candidatus Kapabacteria bacterium]